MNELYDDCDGFAVQTGFGQLLKKRISSVGKMEFIFPKNGIGNC